VSVKEKNPSIAGEAVGGPVMIFQVVGGLLHLPPKEALIQLLNLTGLLSMSLAIFNVLPIPALDGGRLFFIVIEGITRKKMNPRIEGYIHQIGMTVLLALIVLITLKDVFHSFK
jgi:regulator of sigma E protease